jgi:hypothetical protein
MRKNNLRYRWRDIQLGTFRHKYGEFLCFVPVHEEDIKWDDLRQQQRGSMSTFTSTRRRN